MPEPEPELDFGQVSIPKPLVGYVKAVGAIMARGDELSRRRHRERMASAFRPQRQCSALLCPACSTKLPALKPEVFEVELLGAGVGIGEL